jgi:hypothetical protein
MRGESIVSMWANDNDVVREENVGDGDVADAVGECS